MKAALALALFIVCASLAACSDTFEPFVESGRTFALYGFLDARQDTQFVRVESITDPLETEGVNVRVTSTNLATGETTVWRDSAIVLDDGTMATAFFAVFRPVAGRSYRIAAERPNQPGTVTEAIVALPDEPLLEVVPPSVINSFVSQRVTVQTDAAVDDVRVVYTGQRFEGGQLVGEPVAVAVDYPVQQVGGGGAVLAVSLTRDAQRLRNAFGVPPGDTTSVALLRLAADYAVVDLTGAGVTGGVGQLGAAAAFRTPWVLDEAIVDTLGLVDAQAVGGRYWFRETSGAPLPVALQRILSH